MTRGRTTAIVVAALVVAPVLSEALQLGIRRLGLRVVTVQAQGSYVPSGAILPFDGACPAGYTEQTGLAGRAIVFTTTAAGNVTTTGGNDTVTPSGAVSQPTFTGVALAPHMHDIGTFLISPHSGMAVATHASHTHTYTDVVNHTHPMNVQGGTTAATTGTHLMTSTATGGSARAITAGDAIQNPSGGVASGTTAGPSAALTHSVTQPNDHTLGGASGATGAGTPSGTVSQPTFTGTPIDNRQAFVRLIPCKKD